MIFLSWKFHRKFNEKYDETWKRMKIFKMIEIGFVSSLFLAAAVWLVSRIKLSNFMSFSFSRHSTHWNMNNFYWTKIDYDWIEIITKKRLKKISETFCEMWRSHVIEKTLLTHWNWCRTEIAARLHRNSIDCRISTKEEKYKKKYYR